MARRAAYLPRVRYIHSTCLLHIYNTLARAAGPACDTQHLCWCVVCVVCMTPSCVGHASLPLAERILILFPRFFIVCQKHRGVPPNFVGPGARLLRTLTSHTSSRGVISQDLTHIWYVPYIPRILYISLKFIWSYVN